MRTASEFGLLVLIWVGASSAVLTDSRTVWRAGVALAAACAGGLLALHGQYLGGLLLAAGGVFGAVAAGTVGETGRQLLPRGSAPVLTLCFVVAALAAWLGGSVLAGPGGGAVRAAALILVGLGAARLVAAGGAARATGPALLLALGLGLGAGLAPAGLAAAGAAGGAATMIGLLARPQPART